MRRVEVYAITEDKWEKIGTIIVTDNGDVQTEGSGKAFVGGTRWKRGKTPERSLAAIADWTNGYVLTTPVLEGDESFHHPHLSEEESASVVAHANSLRDRLLRALHGEREDQDEEAGDESRA